MADILCWPWVHLRDHHGQSFEEKFGRGSYVHPFSGVTRKELSKIAKARR